MEKKIQAFLQFCVLAIQQWFVYRHDSKIRKKVRYLDLLQALHSPPVPEVRDVAEHPGFQALKQIINENLKGVSVVETLSVGDSILDFLREDLTAVRPKYNFNLAGSWSTQIFRALLYIKAAFPELKIRNLVIGCGWGNEQLAWNSLPLTIKHLEEMLQGARRLFPEAKVIYYGAPPVTHPWAVQNRKTLDNTGKEWVAQDKNAVYLDLLASFSGPFGLFPQALWTIDNIHLSKRAAFRLNSGIDLAKRSRSGSVVKCPAAPF